MSQVSFIPTIISDQLVWDSANNRYNLIFNNLGHAAGGYYQCDNYIEPVTGNAQGLGIIFQDNGEVPDNISINWIKLTVNHKVTKITTFQPLYGYENQAEDASFQGHSYNGHLGDYLNSLVDATWDTGDSYLSTDGRTGLAWIRDVLFTTRWCFFGGGDALADATYKLNQNITLTVDYDVLDPDIYFYIPALPDGSPYSGFHYPDDWTDPDIPYEKNLYAPDVAQGGITLSRPTLADFSLSKDISGIYTLVEEKTNDTLYERNGVDTSVDVKIPDPFGKTGFVSD